MEELHRHIQARDLPSVLQTLSSTPKLATKPDADGRTPVMWALSETQDANIVAKLLEAASQQPQFDIDHADNSGYTCLHIAAAIGAPLTEIILGYDPTVDGRTSTNLTPLMLAVSKQHLDAVQLLLAAGANPKTRGARQVTPLMRAAALGNDKIVQLLLASGAAPNATDVNGWSAVHYAFSEGRSSTLDLLIAKGGNLNLVSKENELPSQVGPLGFKYKSG